MASPPKVHTVDSWARQYQELQLKAEAAEAECAALRAVIIANVLLAGSVPARATKTKALAGDEYELRVSQPLEVTVDSQTARRIWAACIAAGAGKLFGKLFRTIETYVLADGAQKVIDRKLLPKRAPRNLRSLFARAVRVRELTPQLEVRKREKEKAA